MMARTRALLIVYCAAICLCSSPYNTAEAVAVDSRDQVSLRALVPFKSLKARDCLSTLWMIACRDNKKCNSRLAGAQGDIVSFNCVPTDSEDGQGKITLSDESCRERFESFRNAVDSLSTKEERQSMLGSGSKMVKFAKLVIYADKLPQSWEQGRADGFKTVLQALANTEFCRKAQGRGISACEALQAKSQKINFDDATWFWTDYLEPLLDAIDNHIENGKAMEKMKDAQLFCLRTNPANSQKQTPGSTHSVASPSTQSAPKPQMSTATMERPVPRTKEAGNFELAHDNAVQGMDALVRNPLDHLERVSNLVDQANKAALKAIAEILENASADKAYWDSTWWWWSNNVNQDAEEKQNAVKERLGAIRLSAFEKGLHLFQNSIQGLARSLHTPLPGGKIEEGASVRNKYKSAETIFGHVRNLEGMACDDGDAVLQTGKGSAYISVYSVKKRLGG